MADAYKAYKCYIKLKLHFTDPKFDFFKNHTNAKVSSLEKRSDKYYFAKISQQKNYPDILLANFVEHNGAWIGDLVDSEADDIYLGWRKKIESLSYMFKNDLQKLDPEFKNNFTVVDGNHPLLLKMYLRRSISLETMVILEDLLKYSDGWSKKINETYIWPSVKMKIQKYSPFMKFNREKMKGIFMHVFK